MAAAKEAFPAWSQRSPEQRAQVLNKLADLIEAHLEEFAQAESRDQGVLEMSAYCLNPRVIQGLRHIQVISRTGSAGESVFFNRYRKATKIRPLDDTQRFLVF